MEDLLASGSVELQDEENLGEFMKKVQSYNRYYGINFMNIGTSKNTIEFRLANGTIDADTWIQNINLFGGIVRASEDLAKTQAKSEEKRTKEEQKMLESLQKIKNAKISKEKKLEAILEIVIPEKNRDIYKKRYEVNSKLIEETPERKSQINEKVAKAPLNIKQVGNKVFSGKDRVTGPEYNSGSKAIEIDLKRCNPDRGLKR